MALQVHTASPNKLTLFSYGTDRPVARTPGLSFISFSASSFAVFTLIYDLRRIICAFHIENVAVAFVEITRARVGVSKKVMFFLRKFLTRSSHSKLSASLKTE